MACGYVCAGGETLLFILDRFFRSNDFKDHFTREDINNFFLNTCNKFLHSFGQNFAGKKKYTNYNTQEKNMLEKTRNYGFMNSCLWHIDSGGFQASIGILNRSELSKLFELYYQFLDESYDHYDRAFILDIPPGPGCKLFDNFTDVYNLNLQSYIHAKSLPNNIKNKLIYIHHFRTPKLWDIYESIMRDNDLFGEFQYHATGGIVANSSGDSDIPCIIYILPLIPLLNECIKNKRNFLNFHVLGGATFRDILFYELFKLHVKKLYNIDLNITYDSSGLFKGVMVARFIPYIHGTTIRKLDIRESNLQLRSNNSNFKVIDIYRELIQNMATNHNLKQIKMDKIYDESTGTFYEENRVYTLLYMFELYSNVQNVMINCASDLYSLYESQKYEEFNNEAEQLTRSINGDKITRKQKAKTNSILKSLQMLENLSEESCKYVVNKYLSKDEFIYLTENKTLTF